MQDLETRVQALKAHIAEHDGQNVAGAALTSEVDGLISGFYDDIGQIRLLSLRSLFDLFLVKCLYVNRTSTDATVLDYLSGMLWRFVYARELFGAAYDDPRWGLLLSELLEKTERLGPAQNLFEAFRTLADQSLFITGIFPRSLYRRRARLGRRRRYSLPAIDRSYYVTFGKRYYGLASEHRLAEATELRPTLSKLSRYFQVYGEALNEVSESYIMGFDIGLIYDKMLDAYNRFRRTGDEGELENARKYASLLRIERSQFPGLYRRHRRPPPLLSAPDASH